MVKLKQKYTQTQVEKEFYKKKGQEQMTYGHLENSPAFKAFSGVIPENKMKVSKINNKTASPVSFKGLAEVMFKTVKNLFLVDIGITTERLASSRNSSELAEYTIKEGSLLLMIYVLGQSIQKGIEKLSDKLFKKPIDLNIEVLKSQTLKDGINNKTLLNDVAEFKEIINQAEKLKDNKVIYEFLYNEKNANNLVVDAAKKSVIIKTIKAASTENKIIGLIKKKKDTGIINPHKYIDAGDMKKLADDLINIFNKSNSSKDALETFINKTSKLKAGSVAANLGITCLFLGLIVPYSMMKFRKEKQGTKEYHVQTHIQNELEKNFKGNIALKK
jgi:hypothetical protein